MEFNYKWPTTNKQGDKQQILLVDKRSQQELSTSDKTLGIGISAVIFYFFTLLYVYVTAVMGQARANKSTADITYYGLFKNLGFNSILNLNTLSTSFQYSEKIGTSICILVCLALLQGIFAFQNIYATDVNGGTIIAFNYIIIMCWLLFLFVFPRNEKGLSHSHLAVAFCMLASLIINCFLVVMLYREYFDDNSIKPLSDISYILVGFLLANILVMGLSMIKESSYPIIGQLHKLGRLVPWTELVSLILFGVFLILFIQFPPLPNAHLSCTMVPN
jgi:hypothetical protein